MGYKSFAEITVLLSTPRVGSTAILMCMQQSGRELFNEPGVHAYHRLLQPGLLEKGEVVSDVQPKQFPTFQSVLSFLDKHLKNQNNIFIKEMIFAAKHYVMDPLFDNACFFILLRAPEESIISNYKLFPRPLGQVIRDVLSQEETLKLCVHLKSLGRRLHFIKTQEDCLNFSLKSQAKRSKL